MIIACSRWTKCRSTGGSQQQAEHCSGGAGEALLHLAMDTGEGARGGEGGASSDNE